MGEAESYQPTPEEQRYRLNHTVRFEFTDDRVLEAQETKLQILHDVFRKEHPDENWTISTPGPRIEDDRDVARFSFSIQTSNDVEKQTVALQAAMHMYDWLKRADITEPELTLVHVGSWPPGHPSEQGDFDNFTTDMKALLKYLADFEQWVQDSTPGDYPVPEA
jgi:hypothetical protein